MKNMKFRSGTFLEVDDLAGGRKIVMVCKDGVTYWDILDAAQATPVVIHPAVNPVGIGTFSEYVKTHGLEEKVSGLLDFLRQKSDPRVDSDPLFIMRVLWCMVQNKNVSMQGNDLLSWACTQAELQQKIATKIHEYAKQFSEIQGT